MPFRIFYRLCIWLPLAVPAGLMLAARALEINLASGPLLGELLVYSLVYGGLPYALLAAWGTWWIDGRPEAEIRRMMFRAPLIMAGLYLLIVPLAGVAIGAAGPFVFVALLGGALIVPLGYGYVGLTVLLRNVLGRRVEPHPGVGT